LTPKKATPSPKNDQLPKVAIMLWWMLQNTLVIAGLTALVVLVCRVGHLGPAIQHALWAVVLLKFLTPSLVYWPWAVGNVYPPLTLRQTAGLTESSSTQGQAANREFPLPKTELIDDEDLGTSAEDLGTSASVILNTELATGSANADHEYATGSASAPLVHVPISPIQLPSLDTTNRDPPATSSWPLIAFDSSTWSAVLYSIWAGGALIVAFMHWHRIHRICRLVRQSRPAPPWLVERIGGLAKTISVLPPSAVTCSGVLSPCLWCLGRPKLVWPEALADPSRADDWNGVIAHELAHLRRHDHWLAWIEIAAGCLWWFNPLFWLVRKRFRESAELACDAWALWALPGQQRTYAESLVEVTRLVSRAATPAPALGASTGARRSLERRLTMILSQPIPCKMSLVGILGTGLLAILALPAWSLGQSAADGASAPTAPQPAARATDPAGAARPAASAVASEAAPSAPEGSDADRISRLEQQLNDLLKEVRGLRNVRSRGDALPGPSPLRALAPDAKIVAVVSGSGQVTLLDAATGKQLARTDIGRDTIIQSLSFSPDGNQISVQSDSGITMLDAATGKILRTTKVHRKTSVNDSNAQAIRVPLRTRTSTSERSPAAKSRQAAVSAAAAPISGAQLDLVRLATEYSDAVGSLNLAERMLELASTRASGEASQKEVVTAEAQVYNAKQKVTLLREIAKAATQAAQIEFVEAEKRPEGSVDVAGAEAKLRILKLILGTR
jgi:beta-lactamase regulating signal transducer with metallopeptidase domain